MGELDGLDDFPVSLPELGGVSVDFANMEDYERLEQFNMLDLENKLRDQSYRAQSLTRQRSQTFNLNQ